MRRKSRLLAWLRPAILLAGVGLAVFAWTVLESPAMTIAVIPLFLLLAVAASWLLDLWDILGGIQFIRSRRSRNDSSVSSKGGPDSRP